MERDRRESQHFNKVSQLDRMGKVMARDINLLSILGPDHAEFGPLLLEVLAQRKKEQTVEQQQLSWWVAQSTSLVGLEHLMIECLQ